jgi:hypothetical protein
MQEMLGEVLALSDPAGSLAAFQAAVALQHAAAANADDHSAANGFTNGDSAMDLDGPSSARPSARLLNNAAVMHYRAGLVEDARDLIQEAIDQIESGALAQELPPDTRSLPNATI